MSFDMSPLSPSILHLAYELLANQQAAAAANTTNGTNPSPPVQPSPYPASYVLDAKGAAKWDVGIELFEMVAFLGCFLMLFVALVATNIAARKETFGKEKGQRKIVRALLLLLVTAQCLLAANGCFMRIIYRVITDSVAATVLNNIAQMTQLFSTTVQTWGIILLGIWFIYILRDERSRMVGQKFAIPLYIAAVFSFAVLVGIWTWSLINNIISSSFSLSKNTAALKAMSGYSQVMIYLLQSSNAFFILTGGLTMSICGGTMCYKLYRYRQITKRTITPNEALLIVLVVTCTIISIVQAIAVLMLFITVHPVALLFSLAMTRGCTVTYITCMTVVFSPPFQRAARQVRERIESLQDAVSSLAETVSRKAGVQVVVATKNKETGVEMSEVTNNNTTSTEPGAMYYAKSIKDSADMA